MALTLSNRETFAVLHWLDAEPARKAAIRAKAEKLALQDRALAIPKMANVIFEALASELPKLNGVSDALLQAGLNRVNFYELALALLLESGSSVDVRPE
jgi:hypothetical protein